MEMRQKVSKKLLEIVRINKTTAVKDTPSVFTLKSLENITFQGFFDKFKVKPIQTPSP
jgi:hypothetical protein